MGGSGGLSTGGGGAGLSRRGGGGESRWTYIDWFEAKLELAKAVTPKEGEKTVVLPEEERIRRAFGMTEWDPRPTLLYFHYPHETDDEKKAGAGKATLKQCKDLDDEKVARWATLFHCVELDVTESATELVKRFSPAEGEPSFAIINRDLEVIATSESTSTKKFVAFLEGTLPKFEEYWKTLRERLEDQKKTLAEAESLLKKKERRRALNRYDDIRRSDLRIAKWWDEARREADKLEVRLMDEE